MWKLISRGARESLLLERGGGNCLKREPVSASTGEGAPATGTQVTVASSCSRSNTTNKHEQNETEGTSHQWKVTNCFWHKTPQTQQETPSSCKGWWFDYKSICRFFCSGGTRDEKTSNSSSANTISDDPGQGRRFRSLPYNFCDAWLGAVGYSGALIVGWVFSQHSECRLRNWYHNVKSAVISNTTACGRKPQTPVTLLNRDISTGIRYQNSDCHDGTSRPKYTGLVHLLARVALSQPLVPRSSADARNASNTSLGGNTNHQVVQLAYNGTLSESGDQHIGTVGGESVEYGPITAQQAIEEAGNELARVHNLVVGEMENREGVECMSRHEHRRASELFRRAAARIPGGYPPAAHNLAQCYELGLGTPQDFNKAAKWYKRGADLGHAGSMYNLGVFYAHGWGGLEASTSQARAFIRQAASLGHPDAIAALSTSHTPPDFEKNAAERLTMEEVTDRTTCTSCNQNTVEESDDPVHLFNLAVSYENSMPETSVDPYLILQMYQFASEKGHAEAKSKLRILKAYDAVGLLSEYLLGQKKHTKGSSSDLGINFVDSAASGSSTY